ncbi:MAG TPA: FAD-dependent oxidoreductase [Candidatus Angelobacter sp.]|nr:FAD-dependent oxidoreductase [Candidatus Angelobacter sp.]
MKATRREFCALGAAALVGLSLKSDRAIAGEFVNDSFQAGHLLRDRAQFPSPRQTVRIPLVIVGGGMAGLSAAWRLQKRGFTDFVLLEMNQQPGGNSRWGENHITRYPWAAHYVPVPGKQAEYVRELFTDLGVLKDGKWDERYLCFDPQERLFVHGRWQEGIEPLAELNASDRDEFRRFEDLMHTFRASGGFTIPLEIGLSRQHATLDQGSFADWLAKNRFISRPLLWYMNYACRDDYGALAADTSAWAGIHYFCSREPEDKGPLTWPEGNGWITRQLLARVGKFVRSDQMVYRIQRDRNQFHVYAGDADYRCQCVIFAAPTFLAPYLMEGMPPLHDFQYSPWLTANLTLESIPESHGLPPAWDNVVMDSPTLGYVDAMHQSLRTFADRTVWTFYWALAEGTPAANRQVLLQKDWSYWKEAILTDLERVHKDIRKCVSRIDVMRMGHAMVRPAVGTIFSAERSKLKAAKDRLYFANSDLSGISIFEEAQFHGITAAERVLDALGGG